MEKPGKLHPRKSNRTARRTGARQVRSLACNLVSGSGATRRARSTATFGGSAELRNQFETILPSGRVTLHESELLQVVRRAHIAPRFGFVFLCDRCIVDHLLNSWAKR